MLPTNLTIRTDIVNFCNIRCSMCHFGDYTPPTMLRVSPEKFRQRFDGLEGRIETFYLSCACEPLCLPVREFSAIADHVKNGLGVPDMRLITNAVTLRQNYCDAVIEHGVSEIHISIDSHIKDVFETIRCGANFEKVVANIRRLRDTKRARGVEHPTIQFNVVLMRSNIETLPDFIDFAHELGCQQISMFHFIPKKPEHLEDVLFDHQDLTNRSLDAARAACARHRIDIIRMPPNFDATQEARRDTMDAPRRCRFIDENDIFTVDNGDLRPCGFWYDEAPFGNLDRDSFNTVWNDPAYRQFRDEMQRGVISKACCQACPSMGVGDVNDPQTFAVH